MKARKVVLFPTPGAGHIVAMIELAKQILRHSCNTLSITILQINPPSASPLNSAAASTHAQAVAASGLNIDFVELPPTPSDDAPEGGGLIPTLRYIESQKSSLSKTLASISATATVCAIVVDMFCLGVSDVPAELGIPTYVLYTSGAAMLAFLLYFSELDRKHAGDFRDLKEFLEIPGRCPFPASAVPALMQEKNNPTYRWFLRASELFSKVDGVLVNTFRELQPRPIKALKDGLCKPGLRTPPDFPIGPLLGLGPATESQDHECIKWLDRQPLASVVFLCFGSMGAFSPAQIAEIAQGLEGSGQRFLWSIRIRPKGAPQFSEPKDVDPSEVLPEGFLRRTKEKGLVWPKWAPQVAILSHPAVGGFVSHCGWNSTLESVWFGVPMIAWPLYAEQGMNAFELVNDLGLSLELKKEEEGGELVKGEELEKAVRSLMEGEEGKKVREKMKEAKNMARKAMEEGGSSYSTLASLIQRWTKEGSCNT
ncbi:anthocyanidin 3-O-glucosyltransferase 2-like [Nymphaea colorata]|nr:anthocyanidin 3-O-glucosyltransferase 2-like [Nymphaea colorata]